MKWDGGTSRLAVSASRACAILFSGDGLVDKSDSTKSSVDVTECAPREGTVCCLRPRLLRSRDAGLPRLWCGDKPITTFFFRGDYYQPPTTTSECFLELPSCTSTVGAAFQPWQFRKRSVINVPAIFYCEYRNCLLTSP